MRMIAEPRRGQLRDDPVDLDLGADVDPAGRLVEDQHARLGRQPLGEHDLLLVAAGQGADELVHARRADPQLLRVLARRARARSRSRTNSRGNSRGRIGRRHVRGDREVEHEPVLVAVLGDVGDAGGERLGRAREADGRASRGGSRRRPRGRCRTARARPRSGRRRPGRPCRRSRPHGRENVDVPERIAARRGRRPRATRRRSATRPSGTASPSRPTMCRIEVGGGQVRGRGP